MKVIECIVSSLTCAGHSDCEIMGSRGEVGRSEVWCVSDRKSSVRKVD